MDGEDSRSEEIEDKRSGNGLQLRIGGGKRWGR